MEESEGKATEPELVAAWVLSGLSVAMLFMPTMMVALGLAAAAGGMVLGVRVKRNGPFVVSLVAGVILLPALSRYLG